MDSERIQLKLDSPTFKRIISPLFVLRETSRRDVADNDEHITGSVRIRLCGPLPGHLEQPEADSQPARATLVLRDRQTHLQWTQFRKSGPYRRSMAAIAPAAHCDDCLVDVKCASCMVSSVVASLASFDNVLLVFLLCSAKATSTHVVTVCIHVKSV